MAAPDVNSSFSKSAKAGLLALAMATMPFAAANDAQAQQPVEIAQSVKFASDPARGDNIVTRASDYSRGREVVGIAISAGADIPSHVTLQQVGERVKQELAQFGVDSEYFVHKNPKPDAGTSVIYYVDGIRWKNPIDFREAINSAKAVATEALFKFTYNKTKTLASAPQISSQHQLKGLTFGFAWKLSLEANKSSRFCPFELEASRAFIADDANVFESSFSLDICLI
jgi:hypothetical protein